MSSDARAYKTSVMIDQGSLPIGSQLIGRWKGQSYRIMERIGQGANGTVYLAKRDSELVALKITTDASALSLEYDNLVRLGVDSRGRNIGPSPLAIDDLVLGADTHAALAMEYIDGLTLPDFVQARGAEWVPICLLKMLRILGSLHERGYIFGDVKPANILFQSASGEPRLIDFGGVTVRGQAVKEFTEMFDRAWWGLGTRKAEPSYDVIATALLTLNVLGVINKSDVERLAVKSPTERCSWLVGQLRASHAQDPLMGVLQQTVMGAHGDTRSLIEEIVKLLEQQPIVAASIQASGVAPMARRDKPANPWDVTDWGLLIAIVVFAATLAALIWL